MEFKGYKCFNGDLTNRYGVPFEEGQTYHIDGEITFGNDGNGFHVCERMVDTFRFFDTTNCAVAEVTCWGKFAKDEDDYNGYYGMYAFENIRIDHVLSREEIIERMLDANPETIKRFFQTFVLQPEEIALFYEKYSNYNNIPDSLTILKHLAYYQLKDTEVFNKQKSQEELKEVYEAWTKSLSKEPEKTI